MAAFFYAYYYLCSMDIIKQHKNQIRKICQQHKVERLYVFGSILTPDFGDDSDVDVLVKFGDIDLYHYFENLLNLKESLESLLNRQVDILEEQALKNPYLKKSIDRNKMLVYGRETSEMVA